MLFIIQTYSIEVVLMIIILIETIIKFRFKIRETSIYFECKQTTQPYKTQVFRKQKQNE